MNHRPAFRLTLRPARAAAQVSPRMESQISYYRQLADHLLLGEPNPVTPEQARRVIGVIQAAELSAERGAGIPPTDGCE
jgi:hypothetical protein